MILVDFLGNNDILSKVFFVANICEVCDESVT